MFYSTHVFLGPSLDKKSAQEYLWQAHYHPPIQCGDLIRLLRCAPQKIVIIDGLYEQVPAVWHKEIMLALELGIEVYGAASMGALRAAELHHYGMRGIGTIFQAYASQELTDDDEVAVLHHDIQQNLVPLNDAMVNIRATLAQVLRERLIDKNTHDSLLHWCKAQFYPKRSLRKAVEQVKELEQEQRARLRAWLEEHGLIDLKRQDAIEALKLVQQELDSKTPAKSTKTWDLAYTKFLGAMVDDELVSAFAHTQTWLPAKEQALIKLKREKPQAYFQVTELARLLHYAMSVVELKHPLEHHHYLSYIKNNQLFYPKDLYRYLQEHKQLAPLASWLLHYICLTNSTESRIKKDVATALFYFNAELPTDLSTVSPLWSWIVLLIFLLQHQLADPRLSIKKAVLNEHLQEIHFWRRYQQLKKHYEDNKQENPLAEPKMLMHFIIAYMKVIYIHQGTKDFKLGQSTTPTYYQWVYDALNLYDALSIKETMDCSS